MEETAIDIQDLCINYKGIKSYSIKKNLLHLRKDHIEEFQAIKHVSFSVKKGDILGIIGKNGSGKSTLLSAIAGIFAPNHGTINLHGNSVSLLSIGVGFQRELSGRENILLSGMLLGFSEAQVRQKMDSIIEFADIGDFIDAPVKTYSSGMYSKLAFSITAILETDILLIDEILSVGDAKKKKKSYQKMRELISDKEKTVLIVSHSMESLKALCTSILWLHNGEIKMQGAPKEVIDCYEKFMS